jgi:hypothetical protein
MASHPINLALRFLLEVSALLAMAIWSWRTVEGWPRVVLAILLPLGAAVVWSVFAVPNDPSRSGSAVIAIPGAVRLAIEVVIFAFAVWALDDAGFSRASLTFGIVTATHYVASYDRILWLILRN